MAASIPNKAQWQKEKKKYGAPSGIGKADMGKLFNAYDAGVKKGRLDSLKPLDQLSKALPQYIASAKKKKCAVSVSKLPTTPTTQEYQEFWSEDIRDVGTALGALKKLDPNAAKLHKLWLPLTKDPSSIPEAKLGSVRKLVASSIKTLLTEGKKMHLIA